MIFTKYLESLREPKVKHNHPHNYSVFSGQASAEYIILMVVLIGLLAGWLGGLFSGLQDSLRTNFYDPAVEAIISDSGDGGDGGDGGDDGDDGYGCFLKGTKITLADGSVKAIDEIKAGDVVLAYNGKGVEPAEVVQTFLHPEGKGYLIITTEDNIEMKVTANHPIFMGKDYKPAGRLKPGDTIFVLRNNQLRSTKVRSIVRRDEVVDVYDLEVARLHNFFAEGVLYHNKPLEPPLLQ